MTTFRKILVANRSEVAARVIRTARRMGYRTVAVYSKPDVDAPHVGMADEGVCIGDPDPASSYLNIDAVLQAARLSGADAVHPGYGFLAENVDFAQACVDAGLVFIGPPPGAIGQMGNKAQAKALMLRAGVPCVPGYHGEDQDDARLAAEAQRIGYPVMIKAAAGGGGRGMRIVHTRPEFEALLRAARAEAQGAFGSAKLILERAIIEPRHIEIQIAADGHGNVVHLGERDCSVQRRHQKLIEEAPSPAVTANLRARMGDVAVRAARAIGYESLGTMEFLLDAQGQFYFIEMNTRLQVEHPVTEAVTGLDLVELQLRIAAGQVLPLRQEDVVLRGHAIEVRLCAEDPAEGFRPHSGALEAWRPAPGVRVEHAMAQGAAIQPFYDSMFAKVIAHGADRAEALRLLASGLEDTVALGVRTNKAFLRRCLLHPEFDAGAATTAFVPRHQQALLEIDEAQRTRALAIGAALLLTPGHPLPPGIQRSNEPLRRRLSLGGVESVVTIAGDAQGRRVGIGNRTHVIRLLSQAGGTARLVYDGLLESAAFLHQGARLLYQYRGESHELVDVARASRSGATQRDTSERNLIASTGGKVISVLVAQDQPVQAGEPMLILEAMKMEHTHGAPVSGCVHVVHARPGQHVHAGDLLVEIAPRL